MAKRNDIFNAKTEESDEEDNVFIKSTVECPHNIHLIYPMDLPPSLVETFLPQAKVKRIAEAFTIERSEVADVSLLDLTYPRSFIQLKLSNINGNVVCFVKNRSDKKTIELKSPGQPKTILKLEEESPVISNTTIKALNLLFNINITVGDMDAARYEVNMIGYSSEAFNQLTHGKMSPEIRSPQQGNTYWNSQTIPKQIDTDGQHHINNLSSGYPLNQQQQQQISQGPNFYNSGNSQPMGLNIYPSHRLTPTSPPGYFTDYHLCSSGFNPSNFPAGQPCPSCCNGQPGQLCPSCSNGQPHAGQPQSLLNWHTPQNTGTLPTAPPVGTTPTSNNFVNTHPLQQQSPHDFNPYLIGEYLQKPKK